MKIEATQAETNMIGEIIDIVLKAKGASALNAVTVIRESIVLVEPEEVIPNKEPDGE